MESRRIEETGRGMGRGWADTAHATELKQVNEGEENRRGRVWPQKSARIAKKTEPLGRGLMIQNRESHLAAHPEAGDLICGTGGMRKIRWAGSGRGKRGGLRVIYYWWTAADRISMLLLYPKNERDDLSPAQVKLLRQIMKV